MVGSPPETIKAGQKDGKEEEADLGLVGERGEVNDVALEEEGNEDGEE